MATGGNMPDFLPEEASPIGEGQRSRIAEVAYGVGAIGLVMATCVDSIAVAGRHLGFRLLGSIELIQVAVVLLAASSMIVATAVGSHAAVHILTERLKPATAKRLGLVSSFLSMLVFLLIASGSAWVAYDLYGGYEQTELLRIPLGLFRAIWIGAAFLIAGMFAWALLRRQS